jgi:hypothetical protein
VPRPGPPALTDSAEPHAVSTGSQDVLESTNSGQRWRQTSPTAAPDQSDDDPATTGGSCGPIVQSHRLAAISRWAV